MKHICTYILLVLCLCIAACDRIEHPDNFDARQIRLFARIGVHLSVEQTRSMSSDGELKIGIVRMDEKVDLTYPYFKNNVMLTADLEATEEDGLRLVSGFKNGENDAPQFFRNSTDEVMYAAWYPCPQNEDGCGFVSDETSTTITFPIPSTGDSDILYSNPARGSMSTGFEVMQFHHALSLFRIHVYKSSANSWGNLTSVSIEGLPDRCVLTLPRNNDNKTCKIDYQTINGITLNSDLPQEKQTIPVGFENKTCVQEWIAAPALAVSSGGSNDDLKVLTIQVNTVAEGNVTESEVAVAGNFTAGHKYDIVLRFSDEGEVKADVQVQDWIDDTDINTEANVGNVFYNLSQNETANCYVVSSANFSYSFDATVKGNGSIDAFPGTIIVPTLSPVYVDTVWCDSAVRDYFALETNKIVEGKVLFRVVGNQDINDKTLRGEGNVLLGVYDKEGEDKTCLWTWHIWITDKPQKQNYTKGYIVLDRNLGAVAPAPVNNAEDPTRGMKGLFYQWGRPTPFRVIPTDSGVKVIDGVKSDTRVTPDQAVANPKTFYGRFEIPGAPASATNFHDWVDREKFVKPQFVNNLWGYREEEHQQPIKTIYDPCPPGYHVPYSRNWANMYVYWTQAKSFEQSNDKPAFWDQLQGIKLSIEGTEDIWYPFQGYINKDGEYKTGHIHMTGTSAEHEDIPIVEVWSSLINRHVINNLSDDEPYRFLFTRDNSSMLSDSHSNRSRGLAVRCVSDNTTDVVKNLSASQTANCYMVHENGYYKFNATVRGNGVGSLLPLGGTTTAEINGGLSTRISPYKVDVLWWQGDFTKSEDFNSSYSAPENMCLHLLDNGIIGSDGYVAFQVTGFSKGNVILAAYDEFDRILWTWHIWLTDKPEDRLSGNYTKMDRFLGATFAPVIGNITSSDQPAEADKFKFASGELQATFGFYYQWGRKDPIMGPPGTEDERDEAAQTGSGSVASAGWWKKNTDGTWTYMTSIPVKPAALIPDVVKDPIAFYTSTTERSAKNSQWFPESFADGYTNVALWGYAVKDYGIQGQTFSKTMHDPCPPGYRTPFHFSWRYDSEYRYAEGDNGEGLTYFIHEPWFEVWQDGVEPNGIVTNKPHFERMWYPFTGYRSPLTGGYVDVGTTGYMYTGMPMGQYNTRSFWYGQSQSGQYSDSKGHGSAYGKMIRCMKE